jgi:hypothetical protein
MVSRAATSVADTGMPENSDISPKTWPGPSITPRHSPSVCGSGSTRTTPCAMAWK